MTPETLKVSEHFSSVQGEGLTVGTPAVFLRLSGCPLHCRFCDTIEVWKKGEHKTPEELDALFDQNGYYAQFQKGAHLVLTGGDPMLQQEGLMHWKAKMDELGRNSDRIFTEVETQGTIIPNGGMLRWIRQWNVSPKLASSGMPEEKRIVPEALEAYGTFQSLFKFPVADRDDVLEVEKLVRRFRMRRSRIYLMPICSTKAEHERMLPLAVEWCKRSGFKLGLRLQLLIWDKTTGV